MSGQKIQWYLAAELRDRIRESGVKIKVIDRQARKEYQVEPRRFSGQLLHELPPVTTPRGEVYFELYLAGPGADTGVGLYRAGTRVLVNIAELDVLAHPPWTGGQLQGIVDAPFLNLTPGTRLGVIHDDAFDALRGALAPLEARLNELIAEQRRAEEEQASREILRAVQRAFQEALLALPAEEYDWFTVRGTRAERATADGEGTEGAPIVEPEEAGAPIEPREAQKRFFEFAGPLCSLRVSPASCVMPVNGSRTLRALARDRARHVVEQDVSFQWSVIEGQAALENVTGEIVTVHAPPEPGLVRVKATATQGAMTVDAEGTVTVTDSLLPERPSAANQQGLPDYTFEHAPGALWRSRYDAERNVIVINNGHRDFIHAARTRVGKLRYIGRLFAKELVLRNFPGQSATELLERMIELGLYTEEHLK
jgi:hypothetical protein